MRPDYLKLPVWLIVLWLVSLQVLAPFVHAHVEAGGIDHASLLHLHSADSPAHNSISYQAQPVDAVLETAHHPHQVVAIAQGVPPQSDQSLWVVLLPNSFALLAVSLLVACLAVNRSIFYPIHRFYHRSRQPQAPPLF